MTVSASGSWGSGFYSIKSYEREPASGGAGWLLSTHHSKEHNHEEDMEPGEPSFDLPAILIEENAEEQVVPLLFDPLAEGYVVEMSGPLDENIADNKSQCFMECSLNEKGDLLSEIFGLKKQCMELVGKLYLAKIEIDGLQEMLRIQGTYIKELEHKLTQGS
ncbi:unnamed protein product [Allacma fusca]|uniref:Uncharacterized protein n=1 Tax=Allacma fusca TaxID=39272 RepID=A0A8J2KW05_9HEXA|nr:unnamed protein product [Allacma fusca]